LAIVFGTVSIGQQLVQLTATSNPTWDGTTLQTVTMKTWYQPQQWGTDATQPCGGAQGRCLRVSSARGSGIDRRRLCGVKWPPGKCYMVFKPQGVFQALDGPMAACRMSSKLKLSSDERAVTCNTDTVVVVFEHFVDAA
jgi:hypothetical protein